MRHKLIIGACLPLLLSSCQTWGPTWSEVSGDRWVGGIQFRRPAIIERIDNQGSFVGDPIRVEPGMRRIVVSAPVPRWPGGSDLQVMELKIEPCMTYYINAQFENNVTQNWTPVIDYVNPIAGCRVTAKS